jgi:DNA-binding NarL/FixJ family response regulator
MKYNGTKILLISNEKMNIESIRIVLEIKGDFKVIDTVDESIKVVEIIKKMKPDIVVIDMTKENNDEIDTCEIIMNKFDNLKVILISSIVDKRSISLALKIGVSSYIHKNEGIEELIKAIRIVLNNGEYYSPGISKIITDLYRNKEYLEKNIIEDKLSPSEIEVFKIWAFGKSIKESADLLNLSTATIDKHRQKIRQKLNVSTASDVTLLAIRERMISVNNIS